MRRTVSAAALALLLLFCPLPPAAAGQLLEDIRFEAVSPDQEQVAFRLSGTNMPKFFTMKEGSPRLVFDFEDTGLGRRVSKSVETGGRLIERIRVGIHGTKIRAVLDLRPGRKVGMQQRADTAGKTLTVIVHDVQAVPLPSKAAQEKPAAPGQPPVKPAEQPVVREQKPAEKPSAPLPSNAAQEKPAAPGQPPVKPAEQPVVREQKPAEKPSAPPAVKTGQPAGAVAPAAGNTPAGTVLSSVLFEKNSNRGEMVMFRLNKFHPPVVFGLEEQNPRVICDFQDTAAGERVPERINADGKYVRGISISRDETGSKIRAVLELVPNSSYDLQQVFFKNDNLFVLIINPLGSQNRN